MPSRSRSPSLPRAPVERAVSARAAAESPAHGCPVGRVMGGHLEAVVQGLELGLRTLAARQRHLDQAIGEPGVLGEQRAMQISADDVVSPDALEAVLAVIAEAADAPPGRDRVRA